jgi:hypothetical protein
MRTGEHCLFSCVLLHLLVLGEMGLCQTMNNRNSFFSPVFTSCSRELPGPRQTGMVVFRWVLLVPGE